MGFRPQLAFACVYRICKTTYHLMNEVILVCILRVGFEFCGRLYQLLEWPLQYACIVWGGAGCW